MKFKFAAYQRFREGVADIQEPENFAFVASALWRTLLGLLVIVAVCAIAYGFSLQHNVLALSAPANTAAQKSLSSDSNRTDLDAIVAGFSARKDLYDQLKAQPIVASDPSQ